MNTTFFGRFTDAFKSKNKLYLWNDSEKFFSEKKYEESFSSFFDYLGDDSIDNVTYNVDLNNLVNFSFYQGSKEIKGLIKEGVFSAEAKIATFNKLSVPVMRRLMELNYSLYYSRYAVNEKNIVLKFDSPVADCSPRKLYNALREMALQADKQDDLLIEDFPTLIPVGLQTVVLTDNERNIKLNYFKKWIADTLEKTDSLNSEKFSGAISYLLLCLIYKIDYLLVPEGSLMYDLEKISFQYFSKNNKSLAEKIDEMKTGLSALLEKPDDSIKKCFYKTISTFGVVNPVKHQVIIDVFHNNLNNIGWYRENNLEDIALTIYQYIAGYCLFSYGLPKITQQLFHIVMQLLEPEFFKSLGEDKNFYNKENKILNRDLIVESINISVSASNDLFPELRFSAENLKFDTLLNFFKSFFSEIQNLNFSN